MKEDESEHKFHAFSHTRGTGTTLRNCSQGRINGEELNGPPYGGKI